MFQRLPLVVRHLGVDLDPLDGAIRVADARSIGAAAIIVLPRLVGMLLLIADPARAVADPKVMPIKGMTVYLEISPSSCGD